MEGRSYSAQLCEEVRDGQENPFWTIEALGEHVQACWGALGKMGIPVWKNVDSRPLERPNGEIGSITYHLKAIDEYHQKILNVVAALLPDLYAAAKGDEAALERIRSPLTLLADEYQQQWESL